MLKKRVITALVLVPLVLVLLFFAPIPVLFGVMLAVLACCGWEWLRLIPLRGWLISAVFYAVLFFSAWLAGQYYQYWLELGLILWGLLALAVITFPQSQAVWGRPLIVALWGCLVLPLFIWAMAELYQLPAGQGFIVYLFCLIWAADTGAYFAGKRFGRHKLIPRVSPGKSWEGVLGGLILAALVAFAGSHYFHPAQPLLWWIWAWVIVVVSIVGDLFISILKRRCGLKDSGSLLPGHGGILDRLDSLIAAAPWFYFGIHQLMGY